MYHYTLVIVLYLVSSMRAVMIANKLMHLLGTYIINAELPGHLLRRKSILGYNVIPNAIFETRHSSISLNLATAGGTNAQNKTYVKVGSRHGKVNVNLVSPSYPVLDAHAHTFRSSHSK